MGSCEHGEGPRKKVLVTGFGPFGIHDVNASWVTAQELSHIGVAEDVELIIQEMPVEYETVQAAIPNLWKKHQPHLVVHIGVSGLATELTLEQQAHNDGYLKEDVKHQCPHQTCCVVGSELCIKAAIDMQKVCDEVNRDGGPVKAVISHDPGRYLCDFSFYTSLHIDRHRTAFIHVPPLGKPYTADQLAHAVRAAILCMLKQVPSGS